MILTNDIGLTYRKILCGESWKRFLWPSLQCEKELCRIDHRDLPYHTSGLCHWYVALLWWQLSEVKTTCTYLWV